MASVSGIRVGFGLGSNLGDRGRLMKEAFAFLGGLGSDLKSSSLYESEPVDCPPGSPLFLNAAAEIKFSGDLFQLLCDCQRFEKEEGRPEIRPKNSPRPLDIDLLYAGDLVLADPLLQLPHPRLHLRAFVLQPLLEICPERVLPGLGRSVRELWGNLPQSGETQLCRKIE